MLHYQNKFSLLFILLWIGISIASCTTEPETPVYTLSSSAEPSEAGSVLKSAEQREEGQNILIRAIPNKHWTFVSWAGDHNGTTKEIDVLMDSDKQVTAIFAKREYPLTIEVEGEGSVTEELISEKSTDYLHGSVIRLKAEADFGWEFVEWTGDVTGEEETIDVTIDGETNIKAVFRIVNFDLTVNVEGEGDVKQEIISQKTTSYPFTSTVRLTAEPSQGWEFVKWSGAHESNNPVIDVNIDKDKVILATFRRIDYRVRITIDGQGDVQQQIVQSKVIDTEYPFESVIQLVATPSNNWLFSNWAQDASGIENVIVVNVDKAKNITAKFVAIPSITTNAITQISQTGATSGGKISNSSGVSIVNKGICWSTNPETNPDINPDIDCVQLGSGSSDFTAQLEDLKPSTTYYVRAVLEYSHHSVVTRVLGQQRQFETGDPIQLPTVSTSSVSSITHNSASSGGNVSNDGNATVTTRGICWSTNQNPTSGNGTCASSGAGTGSYTVSMGSLSQSTQYYVRAYATNSAGTAYGESLSFSTTAAPVINLPTVSTVAITSVTTTSAVSGGNITSSGGAPVTNRGVCVSTSQNPTTNSSCTFEGSGSGVFSTVLSGLNAGTTYYARAFAVNSQGTAYGNQLSFTTTSPPPTAPPPPSSGGVQIALIFLDGVHFDVTINGVLIPASRGFDYKFGSAGVKVITTSGNFTTMALNPNQIKVGGLNNDGFGFFGYKVVNKNSSTNLYAINNNNNGNQHFWGTPATSNALGLINNRSGDTVYGTTYSDPLFYLGWRSNPVNQPNNRNFESVWSNTGKIAISFMNYGANHPNPVVP